MLADQEHPNDVTNDERNGAYDLLQFPGPSFSLTEEPEIIPVEDAELSVWKRIYYAGTSINTNGELSSETSVSNNYTLVGGSTVTYSLSAVEAGSYLFRLTGKYNPFTGTDGKNVDAALQGEGPDSRSSTGRST